jgi:hypothetical protein|tara:strand:- start:5020 stop:5886 length:867 start_codon:yes stop_codon:yes gene_type:complete
LAYNEEFFYKDSSLLGVISPRGYGKTLLLTCIAYHEYISAMEQGYPEFKIYHNGFLNNKWWSKQFGKDDFLVEYGLEDIVETVEISGESSMQNGIVLLDEVASMQDNRYGAMGYGSVLFSHWVIMIRKIGLSILWAGQNEEVDRRLKMQCDIVGYPVVKRAMKGKELGVTWVYQNGTYTIPGYKRKIYYPKLNLFWDAYDTSKIIKSTTLSKRDVNQMTQEKTEDSLAYTIYKHLEHKEDKKLTLFEIKEFTNVEWSYQKLEQFLRMLGKPTPKQRGLFNFDRMFRNA